MAEGRYGPASLTLEELEIQVARLHSEVRRLNPIADARQHSKQVAKAIAAKPDLLEAVVDRFQEVTLRRGGAIAG
jgi:hypothetical protein